MTVNPGISLLCGGLVTQSSVLVVNALFCCVKEIMSSVKIQSTFLLRHLAKRALVYIYFLLQHQDRLK